jgi:23S rRNA (cytosine1962-C5)-methyltransferase
MKMIPRIYLKRNEEKRITAGHQWVFSNEIEKIEGEAVNGAVIDLYSSAGIFLGRGFYNKHSLIAYRHLTDRDEEINSDFFRKKILRANSFRRKIEPGKKVYRMVNSESDFLPGLIIDRFGNKYSLQIFSFGMNLFIEDIKNILINEFNAELIVEKNDNDLRVLEGLDKKEGILFDKNDAGDKSFTEEVDGIKYKIDLLKGQKTGFYLDQAGNRLLVRRYVKEGNKVLDLFCNEGGFALNAALMKAGEVTAVDSSGHSIQTAEHNASLNGLSNLKFVEKDVFEFINDLFQTDNKYDVIVLDPPSFTKSRKNIHTALRGYIELNYKCMKLLKKDGILLTYSCSHHINSALFEEIIIKSSVKAKRKMQVIETMHSSFDHPVLPQMPETKYLNGYVLRMI